MQCGFLSNNWWAKLKTLLQSFPENQNFFVYSCILTYRTWNLSMYTYNDKMTTYNKAPGLVFWITLMDFHFLVVWRSKMGLEMNRASLWGNKKKRSTLEKKCHNRRVQIQERISNPRWNLKIENLKLLCVYRRGSPTCWI